MKYIFKMKCVTNMHVGSGEENYSIVDNEVQKDVILSDVPAIHSSGVKGALKEHYKTVVKMPYEEILRIFGDEEQTEEKGIRVKQSKPGAYTFFGAKLVARPLRVSDGDKPYLLATGNDILRDFSDFLAGLGLEEFFQFETDIAATNGSYFVVTDGATELEGHVVQQQPAVEGVEKIIGTPYAVANSLRDFSLPVIARNVLDEHGKSKNLWYEEVVPHQSIFYFVILTPGDEEIALPLHNETIQFGGNASIGQGYAKITQVYPSKEAVE
ncbi:RAMP superfamily CRISPR-associated protein [Ruminococcaceae bacterium OttesenSCG-928-A16]|nr:RAMP superfamily CRISPR-associated protein [Ruminococcaceae bacterium OttesenSCG-928-A16]